MDDEVVMRVIDWGISKGLVTLNEVTFSELMTEEFVAVRAGSDAFKALCELAAEAGLSEAH
jgi:hypothetical protein